MTLRSAPQIQTAQPPPTWVQIPVCLQGWKTDFFSLFALVLPSPTPLFFIGSPNVLLVPVPLKCLPSPSHGTRCSTVRLTLFLRCCTVLSPYIFQSCIKKRQNPTTSCHHAAEKLPKNWHLLADRLPYKLGGAASQGGQIHTGTETFMTTFFKETLNDCQQSYECFLKTNRASRCDQNCTTRED